MFANVDRSTAVLAAQRETLGKAEADQNDRRDDADRGVGRQQSDEESADAHERHCDDESVFAADKVAEPAEEQCAERTHGETGREGEQREDEGRCRIHAGKELRGQNRRQGAVDIKVVPLEYCTERRSEDDHPLLGRHSTLAVLARSHCCHGVSPLSSRAGFLFGGAALRALKDCPNREIRRAQKCVCPPQVVGRKLKVGGLRF